MRFAESRRELPKFPAGKYNQKGKNMKELIIASLIFLFGLIHAESCNGKLSHAFSVILVVLLFTGLVKFVSDMFKWVEAENENSALKDTL